MHNALKVEGVGNNLPAMKRSKATKTRRRKRGRAAVDDDMKVPDLSSISDEEDEMDFCDLLATAVIDNDDSCELECGFSGSEEWKEFFEEETEKEQASFMGFYVQDM